MTTSISSRSEAARPNRSIWPRSSRQSASLGESARRYEEALARAEAKGFATVKQSKALNELLYKSERRLTNEQGLPRRPWFKHQIYAPGFYTGYGVKTIPGVREAIEQKQWDEVEPQMKKAAAALEALRSKWRRPRVCSKGNNRSSKINLQASPSPQGCCKVNASFGVRRLVAAFELADGRFA